MKGTIAAVLAATLMATTPAIGSDDPCPGFSDLAKGVMMARQLGMTILETRAHYRGNRDPDYEGLQIVYGIIDDAWRYPVYGIDSSENRKNSDALIEEFADQWVAACYRTLKP